MSDRPVTVRIAPSPTGDPHVGTAYIGLFNLVFARQNKGRFVLRIEDTDQSRSTRQAEEAIYRSLRWAGLEWDEGPDKGGPHAPYRQSERLPIYREHVGTLLHSGHAYHCTCTPERLAVLREQQRAAKEGGGYDGHCRDRQDEVAREIADGAPAVVRLKVPRSGVTVVQDVLRGAIEFDNAGIDDQVLLKSDGFPTYHLANVVDDHLMGITHVIRGEEWISSGPKHVLLYRAFGWELPVFAHLPLLRNADKSKVSKRKNPVSLVWYEKAGILPQALLNYLGMMGWTMPDGAELFSVEDMVREFKLDRISLGGPVFDLQKLTWLNGKHLRERLDDEAFTDAVLERVVPRDYLRQIVPLVKERVDKLEDFVPYAGFFFAGSLEYSVEALIPKKGTAAGSAAVLEGVAERVDAQFEWSHDAIEAMLRRYCEDTQQKTRDVFMPLRVAVTGKAATPPLFETMEVLGRERCRRRMREAAAFLRSQGAVSPSPLPSK
ncbi:MAG: glutamate--tRNA ligase [Pseudomonadota bacterium]